MFTRISKRAARKLFAEGKDFVICPHKLRPGYPWSPHAYIIPPVYTEWNKTFEDAIVGWAYYNASWEAGYYPAFYLES